ncbi:MAG: hypothetical protein OEV72_05525 [Thermoleophilia bacterium]|nr:hypothetical protein [Thermoleophilia bacterium]
MVEVTPVMNRRLIVVAAMALAVVVMGVAVMSVVGFGSPPERPDPAQMIDSGSWYRKFPWPHDGHPYETEHFVVYSDGASLNARQQLAAIAEEVLVEVVDEMGVDPATMFRYPASQDKIDIYASRYHVLEVGGLSLGATAYYAGIIVPSLDSDVVRTDEGVRFDLKHEMVHVVEALLKGNFVGDIPVGDPRRMPVWFSEGTADALTGGATGGAPRTLDKVNALIAKYGRINPIAWRVDLPPSEVGDAYAKYYYPMAQLAVEYLLDADGLGRSPHDLAAVMLDMGSGASFASAFEAHIGLSESEYEAQFFTRMDAYLPQSEFPRKTVGVALGSLLAASLLGCSLLWGFRHWPAVATTTGAVSEPTSGRRGRRGFVLEIAVSAVLTVGFAALLLHLIVFADLPSYMSRAPGYSATAAYLVVAGAILLWSVRRWAYQQRAAWLIPLLLIADAVLTVTILHETWHR